jgi:hypothetical protein
VKNFETLLKCQGKWVAISWGYFLSKDLQRPPEDMAAISEGWHAVTVFKKEYY